MYNHGLLWFTHFHPGQRLLGIAGGDQDREVRGQCRGQEQQGAGHGVARHEWLMSIGDYTMEIYRNIWKYQSKYLWK